MSGSSAASQWYENLEDVERLRPRVRLALQMYANGAVKSIKEAAEVMQLSPQYLSNIYNTVAGQRYMETAHDIIREKIVDKSVLIDKMGRRAIEVIGSLMEDASSEALRLKAAVDLADRDPHVSKVQKVQLESFTLSGRDAKEIAAALTNGVHERFKELSANNFDKVNVEETNGSYSQSDTEHPERPDEVR